MPHHVNKGKRILLYPLFGILIYFIELMINSFDETQRSWKLYHWRDFIFEYLFCVILGILLLETGFKINQILERTQGWENNIVGRFLKQYLIHFLVVSAVVILFFYLPFPKYYDYTNLLERQIYILVAIFTLIITGYFAARHFFTRWESAKIKSAQLEKENAVAHLEALKLQLDPHFLFNNLSILTALVESQPSNAVDYIQKMSHIYRYILNYKNEDLVSLNAELSFIEDYMYLYQVRFGDSIQLQIDDKLKEINYKIPPLTLQLLVENAIKHNSFDMQSPLKISLLLLSNQMMQVKNNVHLKTQEDSTKIGLENIRNRYIWLQLPEPEIQQTENNFLVNLPLA